MCFYLPHRVVHNAEHWFKPGLRQCESRIFVQKSLMIRNLSVYVWKLKMNFLIVVVNICSNQKEMIRVGKAGCLVI